MGRDVHDGRVVKVCPMCGRGIYMDHNLSNLNYNSHLEACPRIMGEMYIKKLAKSAHKTDATLPLLGQYGFPFDDVPREVGGR